MMSVERSVEVWEGVQRHGLDFVDRVVDGLAQGFNGFIQSAAHKKNEPTVLAPAILDIGNRVGQAGADLGASINGVVQHLFRISGIHKSFGHDEEEAGRRVALLRLDLDGCKKRDDYAVEMHTGTGAVGDGVEEFGLIAEQFGGRGFLEPVAAAGDSDVLEEQEGFDVDSRTPGRFSKHQGVINFTSTYDSRTNDIESSLVARGDLWRAEASHGGSTSRNETSPLFLIQLGPVLFVRDTTLLLPVHLSKQHLLWYGYDRKNGMHSLCPALWSNHRRWLLMSMICLNPLTCTFMDLQFPNGQLTYVAGEGLTTSAFVPFCGGLLQAQGQYPGETRFSFSCKNKGGTHITPMVHWPDKSFSLGIVQALAWKRSGLMIRPTIQFSVRPTFGGSNPGFEAELIHSLEEKLSLTCGCSITAHPSAFASMALGRSKWNGNAGKTGIVVRVEAPLSSIGRPAFSVQLNGGVEF